MKACNLAPTIANANDPAHSGMMRNQAVQSLALHLAKGGTIPFAAGSLSEETVNYLAHDFGTLAASVRVAMEYGDLSALEGGRAYSHRLDTPHTHEVSTHASAVPHEPLA